MAKLKLRTTILSKLSTLVRSEGNLVITRDGETLYFDTDTKRFKISDFIDVADDNDRLAILAPNTEKMYYVLSTNAVWRYISGTWYEVTSTEDISDILTAISGKADSNKAYLTDDSNGTDVVDDDYIPFYDTSASAKKKSTFSNLVAKIKAKLITDTYSGTSTSGMSGKAVKSAIDALDVSSTSIGSGETLATIAETDGKISVTKQNIKIGLGQMDNFYRCGTNSSISGSNTWHKIASATPSATTNTDYTLMLAVNDTYLSDTDDNISDAGILYCRVRQATSGGVDSVNYANLKFVANSGLDASKFRLYHKTDSNGITFEIWTSMNRQYAWRRFSVISQGDRTSTYSNAWTLYNSTSPSAAPTESSTCVKVDCIDDTIVNDASLTINQNGTLKGEFTANDSDDVTVNLTDENVKQTDITDTSWRCIAMASDSTKTETTAGVRKTVGLSMQVNQVGTTSQYGAIIFAIGNNIATGNANNYKGYLDIYNNGKRSRIYSNTTDNRNMIIPNKSGTFALTSDIPTVNNNTITIQQNGTDVDSFTLNQASNKSINVTDTKVTQTNNTANSYLPILLANSTTSPETTTVKKNTNLTANPSNGYMDVNSLRIHSNVADHSSNFARLYCANTGDRRYKLPVDKDNDSELAVVADIPTSLSALSDDSTHRVVTDTQISTWNNKAGSDVNVTQTLVSTNKNYPLLFSIRETSDTTASRTGTAQRNNSVFVNPSTGKITNGGNIETIKRVDSSTQDNPAEILLTSVYNDGSDISSSGYIRAYTAKVNSGVNLVIGSGGNTFIGSGEAANNHYNVDTGTGETHVYPYRYSTTEKMFITSDNDLHLQSTGQTIANRKGILITSNHSILPDVADTATNNAGSIGTSTYKWANVYATKLNGNTIPNGSGTLALTSDIPTAASSAPGKVASSSSTGTSTNYARQDHTHGIDLATGDSNGQVKIAGTNVSVKGLGSNAYTSTSYLPLAGGTMTGDVKYTYSTADVTLANNGVSSGIKYPMFKQINDKNGNRIMMIEGLVNSDGTLGIGLNVWNYTYNGTTQTNLYKKGIKMILDKSNSMTYSVDDAANFRTAIGCANNKVTQTSTPLTTDATYRVLLSQNANDTTQTVGARKCSNLTFNPKSGILDVGIDQGGSIDTSSIKIAPYGDNGILDIGNSSNIITRITPATTATSTVDIVLPSQSGTLALQENVPSLTWKSGGSKKGTGNYKTSAPSTCSEILLVVNFNLNDGTTTNIYTCINIPAPIVTATATSTQRFRGGYFQSSTAGGEISYWIWKASNVFYIAQDIVYMNGTSAASNTTCYVYYR